METVAVIGGGASGMTAALTAAERADTRVILLERQARVGRKLAATGNGRCNLTNINAAAKNYHGENSGFAGDILRSFTPQNTLDFFSSLGLVTVTEHGGRVYPLSDSANSVVDVLRFALHHAGVETRPSCPAREILRRGKGFEIGTDEGKIKADFVIVACGGAAGAKLGGVTDGYELMKSLGHHRTKLYPSLVPLVTDPVYPRALKGVRADAALYLTRGGKILAQSAGEVQFTDAGVSGPAAFDISRAASIAGAGAVLLLDFMRDYDESALLSMLSARRGKLPELETASLFTGMLHNRLGRMLVKYSSLDAAKPLSALSDSDIARAAKAAKNMVLELKGTGGFEAAQVTAGGIVCAEFDHKTLESLIVPRLFICGELLDIDGDCGGFNLQWAWASGHTAGRLGG